MELSVFITENSFQKIFAAKLYSLIGEKVKLEQIGDDLMPEKILIDAVIYQIVPTDETLIVDGLECGAEVDYNAATIKFSNRIDKIGGGAKAKVLMHEVVHAILHERGLYKASEDEELVEELAKGFVSLIRQNSELVNFIKD